MSCHPILQHRCSRLRACFNNGGTRGAWTGPRSIASVCFSTAATTKRGPPGGIGSKLISTHTLRCRARARWFFCGFIIAILLAVRSRGLAGTAAPVVLTNSDFAPHLNRSTYQPTAVRDPFFNPGTSAVLTGPKAVAEPTTFHLDGFLGSTNHLTAIVNGWVLSLNKPLIIETDNGKIEIKAVKITFAGVTLEVGGKQIELKRSPDNPVVPAPR